MTRFWQYVAGAHAADRDTWGFHDEWLRDLVSVLVLEHKHFPRHMPWFSRIARLLVALGFLHGDEGGTYASMTWCWTFWRQAPGPKMHEYGWRHYNLPWNDRFRRFRRHMGVCTFLGLPASRILRKEWYT